MLVYLYSQTGWFGHNVPAFYADKDGGSLVITGRSGALLSPDVFLDQPGLLDPIPPHTGLTYSLLWYYHRTMNDEQLLEFCKGYEKNFNLIREVGRIATLPHARSYIVFAHDDGTEGDSHDGQLSTEEKAQVVRIKRGGPELIAEYILSTFNHPWYASIFSGSEHLCDDGQIRKFSFDLLDDFRAMERTSVDIDIEDDGLDASVEHEHYVYNFDDELLEFLEREFSIPQRVFHLLSEDQKQALRKTVSSDLEKMSTFIVSELIRSLNSDA
ncbi:hypothetical protein [Zeimonas arvi]|uniref:Uncharacterized protein n=1 Tax=Zeimonas arvi TaxID=2498847 RepID=A0A5C8NZX1_9BURK|nr:hypothetical protein [Zeimonas arvi]TXL66890.1 hypothetical protein FHP08_04485 [Zeimonas arvi]